MTVTVRVSVRASVIVRVRENESETTSRIVFPRVPGLTKAGVEGVGVGLRGWGWG